jgi:acyl transferase domain-containing protein
MDPQQRLSLELTWEALEDAGIPAHQVKGKRVGVYIGCTGSDFAVQRRQHAEPLDEYSGTGVAGSMLANRISRHFDFTGPSLALDAACASSLFATQVAVEHLRSGTCDVAIVGGVSLMLDPGPGEIFHASGMLADDGCARVFDAKAQGFVRGEGGVFLVLKRWEDCQDPQSNVRAILHGIATNQDGRSSGLTVPRAEAHSRVAHAALANAGLEPGNIGFLELHASGTPVGDPIEVSAMHDVYGEGEVPVWIGSVKAHLGHTEGLCGLASLAKAVVSLEQATIPPQVHFDVANPNLGLDASSLAVAALPQPWPKEAPYAAVHSYGYGGTNVHAVLGPTPPPGALEEEAGPLVLHVCGADSGAVKERCLQLTNALENGATAASRCHWWNLTRTPQRYGVLIHAADARELEEMLRDPPEPEPTNHEPIDWAALYGDRIPRRVALPPYPWQREALEPARALGETPHPSPSLPSEHWATGPENEAQRQHIIKRVAERCGDVLGFPGPVDEGQPLAEHGWDSMAAIRLVQKLADDGLSLPLHLLTDGPSPTVIAGFVVLNNTSPTPKIEEGPWVPGHLWLSHLMVLLLGVALAWGGATLAERLVPEGGVWLAKPLPVVEQPSPPS